MSEPWGWHECENEDGRYWFHWCGMLLIEIKVEGVASVFALVDGDCEGTPEENLERVSYFQTPEEAMRWMGEAIEGGVEDWRTTLAGKLNEATDSVRSVIEELRREGGDSCSPEPS